MPPLTNRRLKCIGGVRDGYYFTVNEYNRFGDLIRIPDYPKTAIFEVSIPPQAIDIAINYLLYRITCFHFNKDERYEFLAPEGWTDKQAMLHQFAK